MIVGVELLQSAGVLIARVTGASLQEEKRYMRARVRDRVVHPDDGHLGAVLEVLTHPACLMRSLVSLRDSGDEEERPELDFGLLDD